MRLKFSQVPTDLRNEAKDQWEKFCQSAAESAETLASDAGFLEELLSVWALSDFIAKSCLRDPDMLLDLFQSEQLFQSYPSDRYDAKLRRWLSEFLSDTSPSQPSSSLNQLLPPLQRELRRYRRREMVRIAWRDLAGHADLQETMADLTFLADACIDTTLEILYRCFCRQFGIPRSADGLLQSLVVFGLGKLGASELNFSSDVDLIFAYPQAGKTDRPQNGKSNNDFFVRLCRTLVKALSEITVDGHVFRVDLRLRPDGENGPLVMSFDNMEEYYQIHGREWERYAWIKARTVAGDKAAGRSLIQRLKPFVYRRYLDYGMFESLRDMKQKIALEVKRKGLHNNIKLGPGGIREIEFFGQIFQLIRGGVTPALQNRRICNVIETLLREDTIDRITARELLSAYAFLRNTEHRLQAFSDQQTHDLPKDSKAKLRLAVSMGFPTWDEYSAQLKQHLESVHNHFSNLLESKHPEPPDHCDEASNPELDCLWTHTSADEQTLQDLSDSGFEAPAEIIRLLDEYKKSPETRALSRDGRKKIDRLIPIVLQAAVESAQPDLVMKRIIRLIGHIQRRTNYISLLLENPSALKHLIRLVNASSWITHFLTHHPVLLDELIDPRALYAPPRKADLINQLRFQLEKIPPDNLEYQMEELCIFRQINLLRVAAADITDILPLMRVSDHLTDIAETILNEVITIAWDHLTAKHGQPAAVLNGNPCEKGFAVVAYGKLGGLELGYGSDLDMVFIHAGVDGHTNGRQPIDNRQFYARLGQRVIHTLTAHTRAGKIYDIDMRLRPSGSSGILVSHFQSFQAYQTEEAWTWEHQALLRTRAIIGDDHLIRWFQSVRKDILTQPREKQSLQEDVRSMRQKMRRSLLKPRPDTFDIKQGRGGIVDIEFLVQFLVLLHAHTSHNLIEYSDNVRQIQALLEAEILEENVAHLLRRTYLVYRAIIHRLNLQEKPARVPEHRFRELRRSITEIWRKHLES